MLAWVMLDMLVLVMLDLLVMWVVVWVGLY